MIFNDINNPNIKTGQIKLPPFPNNAVIKRIDVSRGEDFWILTDENKLYHWSTILKQMTFMRRNVTDFSIGSDGTAVYINQNNEIYIRNLYVYSWDKIDDDHHTHRTISLCDHRTIFTTNDYADFNKGVYHDEFNTYNWESVDDIGYYYHIYCAYHDHSLWIKDRYNLIYKYINKNKHTPLAEIPFDYIKVLSENYAIGIDYYFRLWKYIEGTWILPSGIIIFSVLCLPYDQNNELLLKQKSLNGWIMGLSLKNEQRNCDQQVRGIPYPENPKKIDIGRGEDIWFLTDNDELYHWSPIIKHLIYKDSNVLDFAVGSDGTVVLIKKDNEVYIRTIHANKWESRISDGQFKHQKISICDYNMIFTTDSENHFIKGIYDIKTDRYDWICVDCKNDYYQISCAPHDYSLWIRGDGDYIYRYISNNKHIVRSEALFKYIKALSDQHAIGIDNTNDLWEYKDGNWQWKNKNVKSASINYAGGEIFIIYY
ncbi:hypothetical protein GLOIN_2v1767118 [Rhizophagus irregularis DAOM 181602=DAOM 197198]|nr:hypothetical protein GLOIN_2v1767118 [Rhizophagus irregularis DAOM 181602=DAOM 197198]